MFRAASKAASRKASEDTRGAWFWQWFALDHFVAVGGQVDEARDDDRHLLHVWFLNALVDVHVGVMRARVVVHGILDELEAREPDGVVRKMVGAAGVADRQCGHPQIVEGDHPSVEEGGDHLIAL